MPKHCNKTSHSRNEHQNLLNKFHLAVYTSNLSLLKECIQEKVEINSFNEDGDAAIHVAAERGDIAMLQILLEKEDLNLNIQNRITLTALMLACCNNHSECIEMLVRRGADTNISTSNGKTALHFTVMAGNVEATVNLLDCNAHVNAVDCFGGTPLSEACIQKPMLIMVHLLLEHGANPLLPKGKLNTFLETVLECTNEDNLDMVKILAETGIDINVRDSMSGKNCLHYNAINGNLKLAQYLISLGADPSMTDRTKRTPQKVARQHNNHVLADYFRKVQILKTAVNRNRRSSDQGGTLFF